MGWYWRYHLTVRPISACYMFLFYLILFLSPLFPRTIGASRLQRHIIYAVTDRRALIVLHYPGYAPRDISYSQEMIEVPLQVSVLRADGAGTVLFGSPRRFRSSRYHRAFTVQSGFVGIADVQEVAGLIRRLSNQPEMAIAQL